jgi:hypothetical protein
MAKRYRVVLTDDERQRLRALTRKGKASARMVRRAQTLLLADEGQPDGAIAAALHSGLATVARTRQRFVEEGLEAALKEREWRTLKRDARGHLAPSPRAFVDGILEGLRQLGGERLDIVDAVPDWFLAGHRRPPTGRPPGRPKGAKDSYKRAPYRKRTDTNLPAVA